MKNKKTELRLEFAQYIRPLVDIESICRLALQKEFYQN